MKGKDLRIVYMGTPDFAVTPLRRLVEEGYSVVGVITTPDKPAGRGLKVQQSAVKKYAVQVGLPVLQPEKLKGESFVEEFSKLDADLGVVIAFRMLPQVIWAMPRLGTFNLHASLLPQYRGAAPINWSIIYGDLQSGVTTFMLNHQIDKGDILGQSVVSIEPEDNAGTLHDKLMYAGEELVIKTVEQIAVGGIVPLSQSTVDESKLRPAPKIFKDNSRIDWSWDCQRIDNFIRGLSPYPAAWSVMESNFAGGAGASSASGASCGDSCVGFAGESSGVGVKIFAAQIQKQEHSATVGTIISDNKNYIKVACCDGFVNILDLQMAAKKRMSTTELLRGFKNIAENHFV